MQQPVLTRELLVEMESDFKAYENYARKWEQSKWDHNTSAGALAFLNDCLERVNFVEKALAEATSPKTKKYLKFLLQGECGSLRDAFGRYEEAFKKSL